MLPTWIFGATACMQNQGHEVIFEDSHLTPLGNLLISETLNETSRETLRINQTVYENLERAGKIFNRQKRPLVKLKYLLIDVVFCSRGLTCQTSPQNGSL